MPGGTQTIQLAGQNIQNIQGLQVLPLSALQVGPYVWFILMLFMLYRQMFNYRVQEDSKLLYNNLNKPKSCKQVMDKP
jgi:hypothetical protein